MVHKHSPRQVCILFHQGHNVQEGHLDKILDFIQEYLKYPDRELLREYVIKHEEYKTLDYAVDTGDAIVAVCRWNISDDGKVVSVLDFAIKDTYRKKGIGRDFVIRAMKKFPNIEVIRFQRGIRGCDRFRNINIKGILKRNIF